MHLLLFTSPHSQQAQKKLAENPKLAPKKKVFHYQNFLTLIEKENCCTFPRAQKKHENIHSLEAFSF